MAKMFYTLPEAAAKLGMSEDDVRGLTESGQLQEFRDRDQIMLKVEQVDLLAGSDDDGDDLIPLAESGELEPLSPGSSGSGSVFGAENPMEATGISIFDPEVGEEADPSAATQITGGVATPDFDMDAAASGSGLANIALESDDTSLGADLLDDVYGSGAGASGAASRAGSAGMSGGGQSAMGASGMADAGGDLFEPTGGEEELAPVAPQQMMFAGAEAYDGPGSGLVGGLALGMIVVLLAAATIAILSLFGGAPALIDSVTMTVVYGIAGGGAVLMVIAALVGWVLLRRS